jgi:hypothetical protein
MNRDHRYKYIYYYNRGTEELFDMREDPQELINLIGTNKAPQDVVKRLKAGALAFEEKWGPEGMVQNGAFAVVPGTVRNGGVMHGNIQFHLIDEREPEERGEQFVRECEYAMTTPLNRGKQVNEIFNDPLYVTRLKDSWTTFAGESPAFTRLFQVEGKRDE